MPPRPFYHEFAWAYDLLQTESVQARVDSIQAVLVQNGIAERSSILDAGCGTGRYAAEFARRGFKVCGVDSSPELVAVAKSRNSPAHFVIADLLSASFRKPFDFVLCRGVLNDFVADSARRSIFRQFAAWLRPGGILMFDAREWSKTVARYTGNPLHRRTVELPNGVLHFESETSLDHQSQQMLIRERFELSTETEAQTRTRENDFVMRPWTAGEIAASLRANGLQHLSTDTSYGESGAAWTDRLVVIARKLSA